MRASPTTRSSRATQAPQATPVVKTLRFSRLAYRARQFWQAIWPGSGEEEPGPAKKNLTPPLMGLFYRMQPGDQAHALRVLERLQAGGYSQPDLLAAALLHDVGKVRRPLKVWERVIIVLGQDYFPQAGRWFGSGQVGGGRLSSHLWGIFEVAQRHPEWGAELARQAGASPLAVELIRHHQQGALPEDHSTETRLLQALRAADDDA